MVSCVHSFVGRFVFRLLLARAKRLFVLIAKKRLLFLAHLPLCVTHKLYPLPPPSGFRIEFFSICIFVMFDVVFPSSLVISYPSDLLPFHHPQTRPSLCSCVFVYRCSCFGHFRCCCWCFYQRWMSFTARLEPFVRLEMVAMGGREGSASDVSFKSLLRDVRRQTKNAPGSVNLLRLRKYAHPLYVTIASCHGTAACR